MIRAREPQTFVIETPPTTEEERARNLAANAEFKKNIAWWNANAHSVSAQHRGKFVCIAGQELFVGDDPAEVIARATTAHPNPGCGFVSFRIATHEGPMIHAN